MSQLEPGMLFQTPSRLVLKVIERCGRSHVMTEIVYPPTDPPFRSFHVDRTEKWKEATPIMRRKAELAQGMDRS